MCIISHVHCTVYIHESCTMHELTNACSRGRKVPATLVLSLDTFQTATGGATRRHSHSEKILVEILNVESRCGDTFDFF